MITTRYKILMLLVVMPAVLFAQDDTIHAISDPGSKKLNFYLSIGASGYAYNSQGFYNQQMNLLNFDSSYESNKYTSITSGSNVPVMYKKSFIAGPGIGTSLEHIFKSEGDWIFYMQAEFGYGLNFEQVSGADSYVEEQPLVSVRSWEATIKDTIKANITQHILNLKYKLVVSYKNVFLSFGVLPSLYVDHVNANRIEHANGYQWEEAARYPLNDNFNKDTIFTNWYSTIPIELGIGYKFQCKSFNIEPAVNLDYNFISYSYLRCLVSLQFMYKLD